MIFLLKFLCMINALAFKNLNQKQLKAFINALSGEPWGSSCYEVQSKADALTLSLKLTWLESLYYSSQNYNILAIHKQLVKCTYYIRNKE